MKNRLWKYFSAGFGLLPVSLIGQDLVMTGVTAPEGTFLPGDRVPLVVTVENPGDPDTDPPVPAGTGFKLEAVTDTLGTFLSASQNGAIEAGGALEVSIDILIPADVANGRYNIATLTVDPDDVFAEDNEGNNVLNDAGAVTVEAFADLAISQVDPSEGPHFPGSEISFDVNFENNGDRPAENFEVEVLVEAPPSGTGFILTETVPGPIAAGAAGTVTVTGNIPFDNPNGTYDVRALIDSTDVIDENGNEADNKAEVTFSIDTTPDLEITDLSFEPGIWEGGDPVDFSLSYRNAPSFGINDTLRVDAVASQSYEIEVVLSTDGEFGNEDDFLLFKEVFIGDPDGGIDTVTGNTSFNLLPGQGYSFSWTQRMPENYFGDYFVLARIDVRDNVTEFVEDNRQLKGNNTWYTLETAKITLVPSDSPKPVTELASIRPDGSQGEGLSEQPDMSRDGRYTVFSTLSQLVESDTDEFFDVYLRDHFTGDLRLLSDGILNDAGGDAQYPAISADGSHVVFQSDAADLVAGDTNGHLDVFLVKLETGQTTRVSVGPSGEQANSSSFSPDISEDGRYIVFASQASNLSATGVTGGRTHVYAHDTLNGSTSLVSRSSGGGEAGGSSFHPEISDDGEFIVFTSEASDIDATIVPSAPRNVYRIHRDGSSGELLTQTGGVPGNGISYDPTISADGSVVAFVSEATNLDSSSPDTNGLPDVFVVDFTDSSLERVTASNGDEFNLPSDETSGDVGALEPSLSADGRFVVFRTQSDNLLPLTVQRSDGDLFVLNPYGPNGYSFGADDAIVGYSDLNSPNHFIAYAGSDIYLLDRENPGRLEQISRNKFGFPATAQLEEEELEPMVPSSRNPAISGNGRYVAFASDARGDAGLAFGRTNRQSVDGNGVRDIFVRDRRTQEGFQLLNPPSATLLSPADGDSALVGDALLLEVQADDDGFVQTVEFYANGALVDSSARGDFFTFWNPQQPGIYEIFAVATDDDGIRTQSDVVEVSVSNATAPEVAVSNPANDDKVLVTRPLSLEATASDVDGVVAAVDFYVNGSLVNTDTLAPYAYEFSGTPEVPFGPGFYQIYAVARDNKGYTGYSSPVEVEAINPDAPTITHLTPDPLDADADGLADTNLTVGKPTEFTASVEDAGVLIESVALFVNGENVASATSQNGIWRTEFTANSLGTLRIAWEVVDQVGNRYRSDEVAFKVGTGAVPSISFLEPDPADNDGDGLADSVLIRNIERKIVVEAFDADGFISDVTASINGGPSVPMQEASEVGRYEILWTPSLVGENALVITAQDDLGNRSVKSARYSVIADAGPTIAGVDPADGSSLQRNVPAQLRVSAAAGDHAIARVEASINGQEIIELTQTVNVGEYTAAWTPTLNGANAVTYTVTDEQGNTAVAAAGYSVSDAGAPSIDTVVPADGNSLQRNLATNLVAQVSAGDAAIASVEAIVNGTEVLALSETGQVGRYEAAWTPLLEGINTVRFRAVDENGNADVEEVSYSVIADAGPTIAGVDPADGSSLQRNVPAQLRVSAAAGDHAIARVEASINGQEIIELTQTVNVGEYTAAWTPTLNGANAVTYTVTDEQGNTAVAAAGYSVSDAGAPSVVMVNPDPFDGDGNGVADVLLERNETVELTAEVFDPDGHPAGVDFYINGELLGAGVAKDVLGRYAIDWTPSLSGLYDIEAVATDDLGKTGRTAALYQVVAGASPVVDINLEDLDNDGVADISFPVAEASPLRVVASDPDGNITEVLYMIDGEILGTAQLDPVSGIYELDWNPPALGLFEFAVMATDNDGNQVVALMDLRVATGSPPSVALLAEDMNPADGEADDPVEFQQPFTLSAEATDPDGIIDRVLFFREGEELGEGTFNAATGAYEFNWTPGEIGAQTIRATVIDGAGNQDTDQLVFRVTSGAQPTVTLLSPDPSDSNPDDGVADTPLAANSAVVLEAEAQDADGSIQRVDFLLNGNLLGSGTFDNGRFTLEWTPTQAGIQTIRVEATDNVGNVGSVTHEYAVTAGAAPTIMILSPDPTDTSPADGVADDSIVVNREYIFRVDVSDPDSSIGPIQASFNGGPFIPLEEKGEIGIFETSWQPSIKGLQTVEVTTSDPQGNEARTTIQYPVDDGEMPQVEILSPEPIDDDDDGVADAPLLFNQPTRLTVRAEDPDGTIASVLVRINGSIFGNATEEQRLGEYTIPWTPDLLGEHVIEFVATDDTGNEIVASQRFLVTNGESPTISFLSPIDGSRFLPGTNLAVQVQASDSDGLVEEVQFYLNGVLVQSVGTAPFRTEISLPSPATYQLVAVALDNSGNQTATEPLSIVAAQPDDESPRVVIDHPLPLGGGDTVNDVSVPSAMFLNATATDPDGTITDVRFYINGELLGSFDDKVGDSYSFFYDPNAPGSYVLNAEAIDNEGNRTFSSPILLDVGPLQSPMPNGEIYQPFAESVLGRSVAIFVEAEAGLNDITRVDFYANGVFVGSQEEPVNEDLYLFNWNPDIPGSYELQARIVQVDPGGNPWDNWLITDTASVTVTDPGAGAEPTIELLSPSPDETHTVLNPIELEANALDPLGSITEVRFYANGRLLDINEDGQEPFGDDRYPYTMSFTPLSPGQYQIVAELLSDRGIRLHSEPVTVDVEPSQTPDVRITYPGEGAAVSVGRPFLITATTESTGGGQMDLTFYANGVEIGQDSTFPFNVSWTPQSTGTFQIKVEARERGTEGVAVSDEVTVNVNPTELPTGNIVSPSGANPTVGSDVLVEVEADDADGFVSQVEFFVNGSPLDGGPDRNEPFAAFWRPGSSGTYDLTVLITDNSGNQTVVNRTVDVADPVGVVPRVTLSLTASGNVTPGSRVVARANVFDDNPDDVSVTFFMNGAQLAPPDTEPPYSIILDPEVLSFNAYEITAVAKDEDGNSRADVLAPLYISDVTVDQPSIEIISLEDGETLTRGSRSPIRVEVTGGAVASLQDVVFYADGVEIGRDSEAPYAFDWIPDRTGNIQITAATLLQTSLFDHDDNEFTDEILVTPVNVASPVNVTVNEAVGQLPSISLDILPQRDNLAIGSKVLLYADAQDLDGNVDVVTFFVDGVEVGTDQRPPFTHVLTTTEEGQTALNALATDNDGNVVTSTFVRLDVTPRVITRTPGVALTVPDSGQEGSPLSLRASADGFVNGPESVIFYVNGEPVGEAAGSPYSLSWLANLNGEVTFFSTARQPLFDGTVVTTVSNVVSSDLTENEPPEIASVEVDFPNRDSDDKPDPLAGEELTFTADVLDSGPIRTVELLRDGEPVATSSSLSTPYEIVDTPPGLGAYAYSVVVTDRGGLQAQSKSIPMKVVQGSAPEVALLSPGEGEIFNPQVTLRLRASAEDQDGSITELRFLVNGTTVGEELTVPPYEVDFNPPTAGGYEVVVRARDNSGNLTVSPARTFNVLADNPPTFSEFTIRSDSNLVGDPENGYIARLNQEITFVMEAEDDYGIDSVKLFRNGTEITTGVAIPIEITDTPPSLGRFRYFAEATDTGGNVTRTEPVEIELTRGSPPIVQLVEPVSGTSYSLDQNAGGLALRASAAAGEEPPGVPAGRITSVEFLVNGRALGAVENPPYVITTGDFVEGDNAVVAIATSDTGLRTTSAEISIVGVVGSVPEILAFTHDAGSSGVLVGSEIGFAVEAIDESGIEKVELLLNGEVVDVTTTNPFQLEHTPEEAGNYTYSTKVTNTDGNFVVHDDPVTINVRLPDPTGNDADFVYQTFDDLFFRAPTAGEQGAFANRIEGGDLTRARFVQELMQPEGGLTGTKYAPVRNALLLHRFLFGEWPTREELATSVGITRDSGLAATVSSLMPMAEERFLETVNNDPENFPLMEPVTAVPDILAPQEAIDAYLVYLFRQKYEVAPEAAQMQLLRLNFRAANRDGFTAAFVSDVDVFATGNGFLTLGLGLSFPSASPPSDQYLREVDAASLLINFLRVEARQEEVGELAKLLFTEQVRRIVSDNRYTSRFLTPFPELRHHGNGWKQSEWFGWFNTLHEPWIYHRELGWLAFGTKGQEGWSFWYYDSGLGWSWTQSGFYPNLYSNPENRWLRTSGYPHQAGEPRWFQDLATNEWIQR